MLDALLPPGAIWQPEEGAGLDQLLDGMGSNLEPVRQFLSGLAYLRDPHLTPFLDDLEKEYGFLPDTRLSETDRRNRLAGRIFYGAQNDGSSDYMQDALQAAGFDAYVHINSPAVDPAAVLVANYSGIMGNEDALFGRGDAYFGALAGELLVNGPVFKAQELVTYAVPVAAQYWPLIFFVGGPATRDEDGALIRVGTANIPVARKAEFIRSILKYKPMHAWAGLLVQYV